MTVSRGSSQQVDQEILFPGCVLRSDENFILVLLEQRNYFYLTSSQFDWISSFYRLNEINGFIEIKVSN